MLDLAPVAWSETRARDNVQALLDANPFRKLTLDTRGAEVQRFAAGLARGRVSWVERDTILPALTVITRAPGPAASGYHLGTDHVGVQHGRRV